MTLTAVLQNARRFAAFAGIFLIPLSAYPQTTLTGAMWMATTPTGATSVSQAYADGAMNTLGGDQCWDLWLALKPNATSPVNGPSDDQASISIPLQAGNTYKYYIFGQGPCCNLSFSGLNLFFNGNGSAPGISVFGPLSSSSFLGDPSSTLSLQGDSVTGSGTSFFSSAGLTVVLTGYNWNPSGTPPGDVCQEFAFTPAAGDVPSAFGSFTLQVFSAATLTLSRTSSSPGTIVTLTGSGFDPAETVDIYAGHLGAPPPFTITTTNSGGSFTVSAGEPQHPYGPMDVYALGTTSQKLGAATLFVTPALLMTPEIGDRDSSATAHVVGFGAGETVDLYWDNPRVLLGAVAANAVGSASLSITIPGDAPPGINAVIGIGQTTNAIGIGKFTVK
jgi:hypothetical protein